MNIETIKDSNSKYIGKNIIYYKQIDSTQLEAKRIVKNPVLNGTVIIAEEQTQGKGTKLNKWYTGSGNNIAMTIIIYPNCTIDKLEGFTYKIAECMVTSIKELYDIELTIKLPNDLLLNGKKISGILTESNSTNDKVNYILIGIGFNVNEINFDEATNEIATSLKKEYNREFKREEIIARFCEEIESTNVLVNF